MPITGCGYKNLINIMESSNRTQFDPKSGYKSGYVPVDGSVKNVLYQFCF